MFTFLFTSIEAAAGRWEREPDAMATAFARYHALIETAITARGGHIFQVVADECCIVFFAADAAVVAAAEAQRKLQAEDWQAVGGLKVKMALHSGVARLQGDSYFAPHLFNRLSRILAAANGGQILISAASRETLDELPPGLSLRDLGERQLRDVGSEHIYQLVITRLASNFPLLRTLDARPNNLPIMPTSFVGRETERAELLALMRQPEVRLITLTGPGGSGKTRLSLEVAADLLDEYAAGTFFVPLAAISDADMLIPTIAQTLGLREQGEKPYARLLQEHLQEREMLLLLDNFEQIVAAAPLLGELLDAAPGLKLLVSSREPLHLGHEHEYAVAPLPVPATQPLAAQQLTAYPAIALFVTRAQTSRFDFALTAANAVTVAAICTRLDGLPLAIELAAVRVREFSVERILAGLDDRFTLLQSDYRDRSPRQRSLRGAIDWSYNLLSEGDRLLFRRLGVFVGGFSLDAVAAVCNADGDLPFSEAEGMNSLVDKSLVQAVEDEDGGTHYVMLETIREYASERLTGPSYSMSQKSLREYAGEQLAESGEEALIHKRHARFYLALGQAASDKLRGPEQQLWLQRLSQEHDNLRAALRWGLAHERELAAALAAAIWRFWLGRGYLSEGRRWFDQVLAGGETGIEAGIWANALNGAAGLARLQDEIVLAQHLHEQALQIFKRLGDKKAISTTTYGLANDIRAQGKYDLARQVYAEAAAISTEIDDLPTMIAAYGNLGELALIAGDLETARPILTDNLVRAQALGDPQIISQATDDMARLHYEEGDYLAAERYVAEGVTIQRRIGFNWGLTHALSLWAKLKTLLGEDVSAVPMLKEVVSIRQQMGDRTGLAYAINELAIIGVRCNPVSSFAAVQQFGFTARLLNVLGRPIEPIQRPVYDEAIAGCHATLTDNEFAAAWAAGEAMNMEQAIDYALREG